MAFQGLPSIPGVTRLERVGSGGFSTVFKGYQERHSRWVAVKVLQIEPLDDASIRRFRREREVMGQLSDHPYVVTLYDSDLTADGLPYLLSEFCEGGSFADRLARTGPLSPREAV